jgi:hypothetical protein
MAVKTMFVVEIRHRDPGADDFQTIPVMATPDFSHATRDLGLRYPKSHITYPDRNTLGIKAVVWDGAELVGRITEVVHGGA